VGIRTGITGPWKAVLLLAVGGAGGAAAIAVATVPDSSGKITACVWLTTNAAGQTVPAQFGPRPDITVIDPNDGQQCIKPDPPALNQTSLSWNVQGPPGQAGAQGPPGKTATVVSGRKLTLPGGTVISVSGGTGNTYTITSPPFRPSGKQVMLDIGTLSVPILGFSVLNGHTTTGGGGGTGKVQVHDISISKYVDKASTKLALACANGKHFKEAVITVRKAGRGQQEFLTYKLSNVLISSYQSGGSGNNATPAESITLNFTKISIKYAKQSRGA
jgi:hypothetical protein